MKKLFNKIIRYDDELYISAFKNILKFEIYLKKLFSNFICEKTKYNYAISFVKRNKKFKKAIKSKKIYKLFQNFVNPD